MQAKPASASGRKRYSDTKETLRICLELTGGFTRFNPAE
jgi:hypothetical protein